MLEVKNVVQKILIFLVIYFYACKITIKRVKPKTSNSGSKNVSVCKFKNESFFFPLFCHIVFRSSNFSPLPFYYKKATKISI